VFLSKFAREPEVSLLLFLCISLVAVAAKVSSRFAFAWFLLSGKALASLSGLKNDVLHFHPSFSLGGLSNPKEFEGWMGQMLEDWPMECLCTAHNGRIYRGANARVKIVLTKFDSM